jgi:hypothetical protein
MHDYITGGWSANTQLPGIEPQSWSKKIPRERSSLMNESRIISIQPNVASMSSV